VNKFAGLDDSVFDATEDVAIRVEVAETGAAGLKVIGAEIEVAGDDTAAGETNVTGVENTETGTVGIDWCVDHVELE